MIMKYKKGSIISTFKDIKYSQNFKILKRLIKIFTKFQNICKIMKYRKQFNVLTKPLNLDHISK